MKIGFIGFGEASSKIFEGLYKENKKNEYYAYDSNKNIYNKEKAIYFCDSVEELIKKVEYIFVAIPGRYENKLFKKIYCLDLGNKIFMDLCTTNPDIKLEISKKVEEKNGIYIDVAVLGSVPKLLHKTPMIVSGNNCSIMKKKFSRFHMDITVKDGPVGLASTIKLCRSVFLKGLPALAIETKAICEKYGVTEEVFKSIYTNLENQKFEHYLNILVNGAYNHSKRQLDEIEECIDLERKVNLKPEMTCSTKRVFKNIVNNKAISK